MSDPITVIGLFAMLMYQQPLLTFFSIVLVPLCIIPISTYSRKVRRSARAMQTHAAELSKLMHESFTGNRVIKAYNLGKNAGEQFRCHHPQISSAMSCASSAPMKFPGS